MNVLGELWRSGDEVRCLTKASSSLKTPSIHSFYKIISDNQSTKLVYNLVYSSSKVRGSSAGVTGAVSASDLKFVLGVGADTRGRLLRLRPWFWDYNKIEVIANQLHGSTVRELRQLLTDGKEKYIR